MKFLRNIFRKGLFSASPERYHNAIISGLSIDRKIEMLEDIRRLESKGELHEAQMLRQRLSDFSKKRLK